MKQAVGLGNDQKRRCPLGAFPLKFARLTSVVSLALSAVIDDDRVPRCTLYDGFVVDVPERQGNHPVGLPITHK